MTYKMNWLLNKYLKKDRKDNDTNSNLIYHAS